jgi:hypothetical protein
MPFTRDQKFAFVCGCAEAWNSIYADNADFENFVNFINDKLDYWGGSIGIITIDELETICNYFGCAYMTPYKNIEGVRFDDNDYFAYINNESGEIEFMNVDNDEQ